MNDEEIRVALVLLGFTPVTSSDTWELRKGDMSICHRGYRLGRAYILVNQGDVYYFTLERLEEWVLNYEEVLCSGKKQEQH